MPVLDSRDSISLATSDLGRRLLVVRQDPSTRRFVSIGVLSVDDDLMFSFSYLLDSRGAPSLNSMPDRSRRFVTEHLPAFFSTRIMDPQQPSFSEWVSAHGLSTPISPVEILSRSGGGRFTDTYHVVELLAPDADGATRGHFMISGVRHRADETVISGLVPGQPLEMLPEPTNPSNPRARILTAGPSPIGWVPDWMLATVEAVENAGGSLEFSVVRVNEISLGSHLRVLASLDVRVPPGTDLYPHIRH